MSRETRPAGWGEAARDVGWHVSGVAEGISSTSSSCCRIRRKLFPWRDCEESYIVYCAYPSGSGSFRSFRSPCQRELRKSNSAEEREEVGETERPAIEERSQDVTEGDEGLEEASSPKLLIAFSCQTEREVTRTMPRDGYHRNAFQSELLFSQLNKVHAVAILTPHISACAVLFWGLPTTTTRLHRRALHRPV